MGKPKDVPEEEKKEQIKPIAEDKKIGHPEKVLFKEGENMIFKDDKISVYLFDTTNDQGKTSSSYICKPALGNRAFLPSKAKKIKGLVPKTHFKLLTDGQSVTLEDGTIVTPDDVCDDVVPS